jgi:hypothetical protein
MRRTRWPSTAEIQFIETGGVIEATVRDRSSGEPLATFERASPVEVITEMQSLGRLHQCSILPIRPNPPRMKEYLEKGVADLRAQIQARADMRGPAAKG